jgi:predicted TIM-barrel fold metal-dependent hydrolase
MNMRIVDGHTHLQIVDKTPNSGRLAAELRKRGIGKAVAMTITGFTPHCDIAKENNLLRELSDQEPEMFIPFCTVSPHQGEGAVSELRRAVNELGMKGLKLHPKRQAFPIAHPNLRNIVEEAIRLKIPILFHDGTPTYCTPLQICDLAERYPDATIILGHSGLKDLWKNAIDCAARCDNIHLCTAATPFKGIQEIVCKIGADRVIYGSDASISDSATIDFRLGQIFKLKINEKERERILGLNMAEMLGI